MMRNCKNSATQRGSIAVILLLAVWLYLGSITVLAAEEESVQICRQELFEMMCNVDSSWHDISALNLKISEINEIWWDLIENEGYVEYNSYDVIYVTYKFSNGYATHMSLVGLDDEYPLRYASIKNHINIVQQATKGMTDMEKVLFVNEYVDDLTYYYYGSDHLKARVSGPLYKGYSTCQGYTEAIRMLLRHVDVPVAFVASSTIDHSWNMVQIDGEWYHMDATWDDAKEKGGTNTKHTYFIRNDYEYENNLPNRHYNWVVRYMDIKSTATDYTNWFVHDVKGKMHYYDGLWYYIDNKTGDIVRSEVDVNQSGYEVLIDKDTNNISSLLINKVENNILYYTADGVACEKSLITEEEIQPLGLDWSNADYWRSGQYHMYAGIYQKYEGRICLKEYVPIKTDTKYLVELSDAKYRVLIREMTGDYNCIASWDLRDGDEFRTNSDTQFIAVSMYSRSSAPDFSEYCELLLNGMKVKISEVRELELKNTLEWGETAYWKQGQYNMTDGRYDKYYKSRVCLQDYVAIDNTKAYEVILSDSKYHMLIREMNTDKTFIKSHNLAGGDAFIPSEETAYLAISLYMPANDANASYSDYVDVIQAGVGLQITDAAASVSVLMPEEEFIEEIETMEEVITEVEETTEEEAEITEEEVTTEEPETTEEVTEEEIVEEEAESTEIEPMPAEEESGTTEEESQEASETSEVAEESPYNNSLPLQEK